jgi:uncharacterized protein YbjT (DUF2867 family)
MILVTGATGTTGGATMRALVEAGAPVRALVRDPAKISAPDGVEVVQGSFEDDAALDSALSGVEKAFLVGASAENQIDSETAFVRAAYRAGVKHLVRLSVIGADNPAADILRFGRAHRLIEMVVMSTGIPSTFIRPNGFMQNYIGQAGSIAGQGVIYSGLSETAAVSHVDAADIGAVAAHVLTTSGHEGKGYALTGPEALTDDEIARRLGSALGREVGCVHVPPAAVRGSLVDMAGYPEWNADGIVELLGFYETGMAAGVAPDIEQLLGRPARSFDQFAVDNRAAFGS